MSLPNAAPWDRRYASAEFYYGTAPNDFLAEVEPLLPRGGQVLCLGEGEGRNAVFLAQRGHAVTAVDQSAIGLEKARRLAGERGVSIGTVVADLDHWDLSTAAPPDGWDAIISIWCHLPAPIRPDLHRRIIEALRPGGVFVLEAYRPEQLAFGTGGPPTVDLLPTLEELRRDFAALEVIVARDPERDVREGRGHDGPSAVVELVVRKELQP
jgi:SAM-dependent methyltransferase